MSDKNTFQLNMTAYELISGLGSQKNDLNPDHLFEGNKAENSNDALTYSKGVKLGPEQAKNIRKIFELRDGSQHKVLKNKIWAENP